MTTTIFVISDLHLGGAAGTDNTPDFQICSPTGQALLAEFVRWVGDQHVGGRKVHLVLAGDIVDFLAEQDFAAFTSDDRLAAEKLDHIMKRTAPFWNSLRRLLELGASLTLQLGNHDLELSLPRPRRLLRERLGPGDVDFLYDNQAFVEGPVLIEHGNRYDTWNIVPHDTLREIRSALSRGEEPVPFGGVPGSQVVTQVMNKLKSDYSFVDLLKPENEAMIPLLAILNPSALPAIQKIAKLAVKKPATHFDEYGLPLDYGNIAATVDEEADANREMLDLANQLAYGDSGDISAMDSARDFLSRLRDSANAAAREGQLSLLLIAFRKFFAKAQDKTFDVNHEIDGYLKPAQATANRGFQAVVYGHTHLVKRVSLKGGGVYLNSGTWADLMRVPGSIFTSDDVAARQGLDSFATALMENRLGEWRKSVPTFARIDLDGAAIASADVFFFDGYDRVERVPDGPISRLIY